MPETQIRFADGAAYERMMGVWSRLVGEIFLDWLRAPPGLRWIDVGCGNGAFTELLIERCAPELVRGVDPSPAQLDFARKRPGAAPAQFTEGDAMALPFADAAFDAAVMALVIFFVPDPAKGVAEMVRVVRPGGLVAAYAWDMAGGGFPHEPMRAGLGALGLSALRPPSEDASRLESMRALWTGAGLAEIETRQIAVERTFADFDDYWATTLLSPSVGPAVAAMDAENVGRLKHLVREALGIDSAGRVTRAARANAVKGRVAKK
jgi:ubiquinone/menaquinone biosynthesis C-methylase UbiE